MTFLFDRAVENDRFTGSDSVSIQIALVTAQRVDIPGKIEASIK
jgi:hypothetical protein